MNPLPETLRTAASFDWDTLVPILFFVLYGIAQLFGAKKKRREAAEEAADDEPETDPVERARQIREEIRRKIEERRRAVEAEQGQPQAGSYRYDPTRPDSQQQRPAQPNVRTLKPEADLRPVMAPRPVEVKRLEPVPMADPEDSLVKRLHLQRIALEKARRQQQLAHEQAMRIEREAGIYGLERKPGDAGEGTQDRAATGTLRVQVKDALMDPHGLRKAVLYREILGPPVGMR